MNKRIQELAEQCEDFGTWDNKTYSFNKEKFAELIIGECMACSTWVGKMNKTAIEPVHTAYTINQRIKEHFGVEE